MVSLATTGPAGLVASDAWWQSMVGCENGPNHRLPGTECGLGRPWKQRPLSPWRRSVPPDVWHEVVWQGYFGDGIIPNGMISDRMTPARIACEMGPGIGAVKRKVLGPATRPRGTTDGKPLGPILDRVCRTGMIHTVVLSGFEAADHGDPNGSDFVFFWKFGIGSCNFRGFHSQLKCCETCEIAIQPLRSGTVAFHT